ncbi:hypothetical protein [Rhodococcoides fascians]|nr:hypothetical protein [Rhodococcus fascians]
MSRTDATATTVHALYQRENTPLPVRRRRAHRIERITAPVIVADLKERVA